MDFLRTQERTRSSLPARSDQSGHSHQGITAPGGIPPSQRPRVERSSLFSSTSSWASSSLSAILGKNKAAPEKMPLQQVKLKFELALQDFEGQDVDRLRYQIRGTRDVRDLWYLRSDMHSLIAKRQSQHEASERINKLLACFEGWIPSQQLTEI